MNSEYIILFVLMLVSLFLAMILELFSMFISFKNPSMEKNSPYECGFNPIHHPGKPFSIKFFMIAMLFLIFDLEILYLFPWAVASGNMNMYGQAIVIAFMMVLYMGLYYEWKSGGLEWTNSMVTQRNTSSESSSVSMPVKSIPSCPPCGVSVCQCGVCVCMCSYPRCWSGKKEPKSR